MSFIKKIFRKDQDSKKVVSKRNQQAVEDKKAEEEIKKETVRTQKELIKKKEEELREAGYITCILCDRPIINHTMRKCAITVTENGKKKEKIGPAHQICIEAKGIKPLSRKELKRKNSR